MLRKAKVDAFTRFIPGTVLIEHPFDWDPERHCPEAYHAIRRYDSGNYIVAFNQIRCRWQIWVKFNGGLSLVKTWQDEKKDYLPFTMKVYEYLVATDFETHFGTRDPDKVSRALDSLDDDEQNKNEIWIANEIEDYKRYERRTLAKQHMVWHKKYGFDPGFLVPEGRGILV